MNPINTVSRSISVLVDSIQKHHLDTSTATPSEYFQFFTDVVHICHEPSNKAALSNLGREISIINSTIMALRYISQGTYFNPGDATNDINYNKTMYLSLGNTLNLFNTGVEMMKMTLPASYETALVSVDAPMTFMNMPMLEAASSALVLPTNVAYAGYNYYNILSELPVLGLAGTVNPFTGTLSTAEKIMHASSFLGSGTSLMRFGAYFTNIPTVPTVLGVVSATFGGLRYLSSKKVEAEKKSPLIAVKRDLANIVDQMYKETMKTVQAENDQNSSHETLGTVNKIFNACKNKITQCNDEETLVAGFEFAAAILNTLGESIVPEKLTTEMGSLIKTCGEEIKRRHELVGKKIEAVKKHEGFIDRKLEELQESLNDYPDIDAVGDPIERYRIAEMREAVVYLIEEKKRLVTLLSEPPRTIVMTSWLDEANYLCGENHRAYIDGMVRAALAEPDPIDVYRM